MLGNYQVATQLVASRIALRSTGLVSYGNEPFYFQQDVHHHTTTKILEATFNSIDGRKRCY
jgi:hypothetical protein